MRIAKLFVMAGAAVCAWGGVATDEVTGYAGRIKMSANRDGESLTVVLTEKGPPNKLAFVLQYEPAKLTAGIPEWTGDGRVLVSGNTLAIVGQDGFKRLFLFEGQTMPASLGKLFRQGDALAIFGIATYGQGGGLTEAKIAALQMGPSYQPPKER